MKFCDASRKAFVETATIQQLILSSPNINNIAIYVNISILYHCNIGYIDITQDLLNLKN